MLFRDKGPRVVISGYYGFNNCGDEAVLYAIIHCLRRLKPNVRITVLSNNPESTRAMYNVRAVDRWSPFQVARELFACHLFISGGGSLIQDVTSVKSARYYLAVIRLARLLARKTMIYGQGVGPLSDQKIRERTASVFENCDEITVRDEGSASLLREIGVKRDITVTCDPVLALSYEDIDREEIREYLHEMNILDKDGRKHKPLLLVTVRRWKDDRHLPEVAALLDEQARKGWDVLLAPMHFPMDMQAIDIISNLMNERLYCLGTSLSASQFLALTAYADKVFSMRLHGLIFAMALGAPMIGLSYDPKVDGFMELAGLRRDCLSFEDFNRESAESLIEDMESEPLIMLTIQERRRQELRDAAWDMAGRAVSLLSKEPRA